MEDYRCIAAPCTAPALSLQVMVPLCRAHWERVSKPTQQQLIAATVAYRAMMPYKRGPKPNAWELGERYRIVGALRDATWQALHEAGARQAMPRW